jgi:hypothetical protein
MISITHLDGSDVVVIDASGQQVPAVGEVRVELDRAVVAVHLGSRSWLNAIFTAAPNATLACEIRSRAGHVYWHGPVRIAYA